MPRAANPKPSKPALGYGLNSFIEYDISEQLTLAQKVDEWLNSLKNSRVEACSLLDELVTLTNGKAGTHCTFIFNVMRILQKHIIANISCNGVKNHDQLWADHLVDVITQLAKFLEPNNLNPDYPSDSVLRTTTRVVPFECLLMFVDTPYFRPIILKAIDRTVNKRQSLELKSMFLALAVARLIEPEGVSHRFYDHRTKATHTKHGVCHAFNGSAQGHLVLPMDNNSLRSSSTYTGRAYWVVKHGGITQVSTVIDNQFIADMCPSLKTALDRWRRACPANYGFEIL